jgi:uncharacterized protein
MYRGDDGRLVLSPSDLVGYLHCPHLTELDMAVVDGGAEAPERSDPGVELVQRKGDEHERAWLEHLEAQGLSVVRIPDGPDLPERTRLTADALADGPDIVYQATFVGVAEGQRWRGHADFLYRDGPPSRLGPFSYRPADTKLAHRVTPSAVLQLSEYAEQLEQVQGAPVETISVVLGTRREEPLRRADFAAYHRAARRRFVAALEAGITAEPVPVPHCSVCNWAAVCDERRRREDHLTLVAGLGADQARKLQMAGVTTMTALAELADDAAAPVKGIGVPFLDRLRSQARLQAATDLDGDGPPRYELVESEGPGKGLEAMFAPSPGDLFFDIESDPWFADGGLEYLFGVGWVEADGTFAYRAFWGHDRAGEKAAFENLVDFVVARRAADPDLHVYHYANYERDALSRLMGRHGTRETEIDDLLRGGVLVDLYRVVRQAVRIGTPSYSLKKIESLYRPRARTEAITDGGSSIAEYERFVETNDTTILDRLAEYNEVDCDSTRGLRDWLEDRRTEYAERFGTPVRRPPRVDAAASEGVEEDAGAVAGLAGDLAAVGDADGFGWARSLLADLLEWHRREEKPEWWRYFDRVEHCDEADLYEDTEALAGLEFVDEAAGGPQTKRYRYRFDPEQECKLDVGDPVLDPEAEARGLPGWPGDGPEIKPKGPGKLVAFDAGAGTLELQRKAGRQHPRCLIPPGPVPSPAQKAALRRVASAVVEDGIDGPGPVRAVRDLLLRHPPRLRSGLSTGTLLRQDEPAAIGARRLATALDGGVLAVQGPPGSGKTRAAAAMVLDLIADGRRVGVTAHSHSVIRNLVSAILAETDRRDAALEVSQVNRDGEWVDDPRVRKRRNADDASRDLDDGVQVLAGTSWLFARPEFDGRLDVLVVDEAGQQSLANTMAAGTAAKNLVLVGDPQQLAQPSRGSHPPGAAASALGHVLGDHATMPADLGVFLDHTHRLHPDICAFVSEVVYDDKLSSTNGCERQSIGGDGPLSGAGLRWLPVEHFDDRVRSVDEAAAIDACYRALLGRTVTDRNGAHKDLGADDILVVAPYNAQVALLTRTLPAGAHIGTVDRFQGQEADVVLVSLTTSSAERIPRGMEFLYSHHRLNVAVSRARALVVMAGSPRLLAVDCHTVEQMRLANGLCRYVELATEMTIP